MKKQDRFLYPALFNYGDNEISVFFPDFNVATSGVDEFDAFFSARELLGITILGYEDDNIPLPSPTRLKNVKCESNEQPSLIDVYIPKIKT